MRPALRKAKRWYRLGSYRFHERYLRSFIFIHINKTGGSSIEHALGLRLEHRTALEKRADLGGDLWERRFSFAFVRNPWDRVTSHYHYRVMKGKLGTEPIGFNEWVRLAYDEREPRYYSDPKMFMPQWNWISDGNGQVLVDFVGRFETLEQDFGTICAHLGIEATLPHRKSSTRGHYRDYYDDESIQIVERCFAMDIERFGYVY